MRLSNQMNLLRFSIEEDCKVKTDNNDKENITEIVNQYFNGTYKGDAEQLKRAFHTDAHITGVLNGEYFDWTLLDFLERVTKEPTASSKKEKYDKEILFIDITKEAAMVKARVAVGPYIFIDYITLLKINGHWIIRNKSFTAT